MKNLNLENYGVQEMNAQEMKEVDGGNVPMSWYMNDATIDANSKLVGPSLKNLWNFLNLISILS